MTGDRGERCVRVLTWNVHACVGGDGRFDPDRVAAIVRRASADIVALQEVDSRWRRSTGLDVFAFLRDRIGGHAAEARTIETGDGDYGHMVLSRWPLRRSGVHDISAIGRERRAIIDVDAWSPHGAIRVICAHFGLRRSERRGQTEILRALTQKEPNGATIVAGDFNELRRRSATHVGLAPSFQAARSAATYPSWHPVFALDRIWCRPPLHVRQSHVLREGRGASDHLPLIADLDWIGERNCDL